MGRMRSLQMHAIAMRVLLFGALVFVSCCSQRLVAMVMVALQHVQSYAAFLWGFLPCHPTYVPYISRAADGLAAIHVFIPTHPISALCIE